MQHSIEDYLAEKRTTLAMAGHSYGGHELEKQAGFAEVQKSTTNVFTFSCQYVTIFYIVALYANRSIAVMS